jgi:lipid A 3-O-deacylase PagL
LTTNIIYSQKRFFYLLLVFFISTKGFNQVTNNSSQNTSFFFTPEIIIGKTLEANEGFPKTNLQKGIFLSFGRYNQTNNKEWAVRLNYPKTGVSLSIIDFGNTEKVGKAYTIMPFMEFELYKRWHFLMGVGGSYMDTQYDLETNPFNKAITTKLNMSLRAFMYYNIFKNSKMNWRFGFGLIHHSNGHSRLPNQGLNSLLASISSTIDSKSSRTNFNEQLLEPKKVNTQQTYFSTRIGFGQNVLSEIFNDKKPVYTIAFSAGKIINKTFKFGGGFYYRFYKHYYDYIKNDEALVEEEFPIFKTNPFGYASNFGLFGSVEILMDHFGFEFELGLNIHKPFYQIDWKLNEGYSYRNANNELIVIQGELDWYYEIKRTISSRIGLKYYFITNEKTPKHNLYIAAHINANFGQADFTELSLGYVYRAKLKERKK